MFAAASLMLLNKVDLLPYLNFDVEKCIACAREVNPEIEIILISATSGEGMDQRLSGWRHSDVHRRSRPNICTIQTATRQKSTSAAFSAMSI